MQHVVEMPRVALVHPRVAQRRRAHAAPLLLLAFVALSLACEPVDEDEGDAPDEELCELAPRCDASWSTQETVGDTTIWNDWFRPEIFDPATCPPALRIETRFRSDALGRMLTRTSSYDSDDDGIFDTRYRSEWTYASDDAFARFATETQWADGDGDGVDEVRRYTVFGEPTAIDTPYVLSIDDLDDGVFDTIVRYEVEVEALTVGARHRRTTTTDLGADGDDDIVEDTVDTLDPEGLVVGSVFSVTGETDEFVAESTIERVGTTTTWTTEYDDGLDGTIDRRSVSMWRQLDDGSQFSRYEDDDDADGTPEYVVESTYALVGTVSRSTFDVDQDGDGVFESKSRYDSGVDAFGVTDYVRQWFDEDGDDVFERIHTTDYAGGDVVMRELRHEQEGILSRAVYVDGACAADPPWL